MSRVVTTGFEVLRHRVARLERSVPTEIYAPPEDSRPNVTWFTDVLAQRTDLSQTVDERGLPVRSGIEPEEADAIVAECALLGRLRECARRAVDGPVDLAAQEWVHHRAAHLPPRPGMPMSEHFVPVEAATVPVARAKPWNVGFFTSTSAWDGWGMWRVYQDVHSSMYEGPLPRWHLDVEPGAAVYEIRSAADWVRFVRRYPVVVDGRAYPDWPSVAKEWDGVHFTAFAIAATQGLVFGLDEADIQPLALDVEQTFWLSWRFTGATEKEASALG